MINSAPFFTTIKRPKSAACIDSFEPSIATKLWIIF